MSKSNIAGYDIEKNPVAPNLLLEWEGGDVTVYVPHITAVENGYQLSWTNDAGLENPETITITNGTNGIDGTDGVNGTDGAPGTTFTPTVTPVTGGYQLSWSNNGGLPNPQTVTIYNGDADDGVTFTPTVTQVTGGYQISWTNNGGLPNPQTVTIYDGINGVDGDDGANGITFTPTIEQITGGYQLSWTNDGGAQNPPTVNIMNGANGVSPTVTVSRVSGGVEISVTDGSGTSSEVLHDGAQGSRGVTFTPTITETANGYQLSWSNDGELINPPTVQITNGASGQAGNDGITYTPTVQSISGGYQLSWTNDGGAQNPPTVNIMNGITPSITATASSDNLSSDTPTVTVTKTGTNDAPNFNFAFSGLKGAQGPQGSQGPQGVQGIQGAQGATGPAGPGVPAGGTGGQILVKNGSTDYATVWGASPYVRAMKYEADGSVVGPGQLKRIDATDVDDGSSNTNLQFTLDNYDTFNVGTVPPGGTEGQVLVKSDSGDYFTMWANPSGGGISLNGMITYAVYKSVSSGGINYEFDLSTLSGVDFTAHDYLIKITTTHHSSNTAGAPTYQKVGTVLWDHVGKTAILVEPNKDFSGVKKAGSSSGNTINTTTYNSTSTSGSPELITSFSGMLPLCKVYTDRISIVYSSNVPSSSGGIPGIPNDALIAAMLIPLN